MDLLKCEATNGEVVTVTSNGQSYIRVAQDSSFAYLVISNSHETRDWLRRTLLRMEKEALKEIDQQQGEIEKQREADGKESHG